MWINIVPRYKENLIVALEEGLHMKLEVKQKLNTLLNI
jgi:hypothetical protein